MTGKISPLAPEAFPEMPAVAGVRLSTAACGIRYRDRSDACLVELAEGSSVAGVFTRSRTASAPVEWCRRALSGGRARAVLINSGNANAFTGAAGVAAVERSAKAVAELVGCRPREVFLASTGVIGEPLPDERLRSALRSLQQGLSPQAWQDAAEAIMTTDTYPKGTTRRADLGGATVTINGIAKGSGMIAPDMATMLAFVFTDACLPPGVLQQLLTAAVRDSFNAITVDSDTSTSDTVLLCATGVARHPKVAVADEPRLRGLRAALDEVMVDLAQQVVRDGEGAEKFVTINVSGAASRAAARRIGLAIGNSPLVKTAVAGGDANWGRIVMAVGKAGEKADRDRLSIRIGGIEVARDGMVVPGYDEAPVARHMQGREIELAVDVGVGRGRATVWTCDLTHGYIDINADYRS